VIEAAGPGAISRYICDQGHGFDLFYLHRFDVAERCIALIRFHAPKAIILFNNADMHFLRMQRRAQLLCEDNADLSLIDSIKAREFAVSRAVDCTLVCNLEEQKILARAVPDAFCHYLPWVIECRNDPSSTFEEREDIMFLGGFKHPPNLDAVQWFVREVMPTLRQLLPAIRLHVYGSEVPDELHDLASDHVVISGHVADLATAFNRHRVNIVPVRYGAGFKGKLAASLAHGVPSVATPIGMEGTGICDAEHVLVAKDAVMFAATVACLYTNEALWIRLALAGRGFVREQLSPASARDHFLEILGRLNYSLGQPGDERAGFQP
jgi:O-antigen biosynthesis protein